MTSVDDKITSIKENLKEIVSKYTPFYNKQIVPEEGVKKPSDQSCREMYDEVEVDQSFTNISSF